MTSRGNRRTPRTVGVVLAGGLSRRMGGGDKGLLGLGTTTMIGEVIERLGPQVGALVVNANGDPERFAELALPVVADPVDGFIGPLAGVLAGLRWAERNVPGARYVASVSSDAPFLPDDLVARLAGALRTRPDAIAIARSRGELHPVIGLWPVSHADDLEAALRSGVRKVLSWTDRHGTVPVDFEDRIIGGAPVDPFFNANTPDELAEARAIMARPALPPVPVIGIAGWKNSGKTTLAERLIAEITRRGYRVASVKHAHHAFEIDPGDTDSARHRRAGAVEVAIVSSRRVATIAELSEGGEPPLAAVLGGLRPADLVIVEGYKRAAIPKIEVRRLASSSREPLADHDRTVIAIAADHPVDNAPVAVFTLDAIGPLADLVIGHLRLARGDRAKPTSS